MKKYIEDTSAMPSKRTFLPIIADYDFNMAICELIDNVLDIWLKTGKTKHIEINLDFEMDQQTICISDNAGGIKKSELHYIVGPGHTGNKLTDETIGVFGVGSKRAVVALAQDVKITSRHRKEQTYLLEFDEEWLKSDDWEVPVYQVDNIAEGSTRVHLQRLRIQIDQQKVERLIKHLGVVYAYFLQDSRLTISVDDKKIQPKTFDRWAYPPTYEPRQYKGILHTNNSGIVQVQATAGLTLESSPALGDYGIDIFCNDRLIVTGLKSHDVGFTSGLIGHPHPNISIVKVIVTLKGQARAMPWNSSKNAINPNHEVFLALREWIIGITKEFASLARRWQGEWPDKVFKFSSGKMETVPIRNFAKAKKSYLPELPASKPRYQDKIAVANKRLVLERPWVKGLYESICIIDQINKMRLAEKNRICLIILDSTLEIAFKEYLVNESGKYYSNEDIRKIFQSRDKVHTEIKHYIELNERTWGRIQYYYDLRCKLVHERATVPITDEHISILRETVEDILNNLYGLVFHPNECKSDYRLNS